MPNRLTSTSASATSAIWSPTGETILQAQFERKSAVVDVLVRVNASAEWRVIEQLAFDMPFVRLPKFPFIMLALRENVSPATVNVWDDAA